MSSYKLIGPFTQIIPLRALPLKGSISDDVLEIIENGGVVVNEDKVVAIGRFDDLRQKFVGSAIELIQGHSTLIPGFIDSHTHICFAGNRARDYAMRVSGKSYLEIARAGGGIWDSVTRTREASIEELAASTTARASRLLANGITTVEVKSGYGLSVDAELRMLRAIEMADRESRVDLVSTCLAAHIKPRDFEGNQQEYLEMIVNDLLPVVRRQNLSNRIDIFVEESAFDISCASLYLRRADDLGFDITVHADQFSTGGSALAVEVGALSADHLEASGDAEVRLLADSNTVAVALPGASLGLGMQFTPARKLLDAGACLAIASDWNPGSAPMGDLLTQASIIGAYEKLSLSETIAGLTFRAAAALGLVDRGRIDNGMMADFQAYPTTDYRDIFYHQGSLKPAQVWKSGRLV